jgi:hypothetical protein
MKIRHIFRSTKFTSENIENFKKELKKRLLEKKKDYLNQTKKQQKETLDQIEKMTDAEIINGIATSRKYYQYEKISDYSDLMKMISLLGITYGIIPQTNRTVSFSFETNMKQAGSWLDSIKKCFEKTPIDVSADYADLRREMYKFLPISINLSTTVSTHARVHGGTNKFDTFLKYFWPNSYSKRCHNVAKDMCIDTQMVKSGMEFFISLEKDKHSTPENKLKAKEEVIS